MTTVEYDYAFFAGYFKEEQLILNNYTLQLQLYINDISEYDQDIAFSRIDILIYEFFDNAIFVSEDDIEAIDNITRNDLKCITFPDPGPIDQIIQLALISKLNAITENVVTIFRSELTSFRSGGIKYIENYEEDYQLISNGKDKWWNNSKPSTFELLNNDNLTIFDGRSWSDFELAWEKDLVEQANSEEDTEIIFTPETSNIVTLNLNNETK